MKGKTIKSYNSRWPRPSTREQAMAFYCEPPYSPRHNLLGPRFSVSAQIQTGSKPVNSFWGREIVPCGAHCRLKECFELLVLSKIIVPWLKQMASVNCYIYINLECQLTVANIWQDSVGIVIIEALIAMESGLSLLCGKAQDRIPKWQSWKRL